MYGEREELAVIKCFLENYIVSLKFLFSKPLKLTLTASKGRDLGSHK